MCSMKRFSWSAAGLCLLILVVAVSFYKLSQLKTLKVRQKVATTKIQKAEEAENQEGSDEYGGKFPL